MDLGKPNCLCIIESSFTNYKLEERLMDPQKNANAAVSDEQKDAPLTSVAPQDTTPPNADASAPLDVGATSEMDTMAPPSSDSTDASAPSVMPASSDDASNTTATDPTATPTSGVSAGDVKLGDTPPSLASEEPASAPVSDVSDAPLTPAAGPGVNVQSSSETEVSTPADTPLPASDSQGPSSSDAVPPTVPAPAASSDKKTVVILSSVAVVLIAAIAVLYFMY